MTGSSGLIGSEAVKCFDNDGHRVFGMDNNMRREFFGPQGDTRWVQEALQKQSRHFTHLEMDIRDRPGL